MRLGDRTGFRIEHVTVVSPERSSPLTDASVLIRGDRIVSISSKASADKASSSGAAVQVIDGRGLYLAPGLIDSHVHSGGVPGMSFPDMQAHPGIARAGREQVPRSYLYFGFTTLIDLDARPAQLTQWDSYAAHPDIYFCGATPIVDGYPMNWEPKPARYEAWPYMLVQSGEEAALPAKVDPAAHTPEAVVSRMKADGMFCVKSFYERGTDGRRDLPASRLETMRSLVRAAHAAGMPVFLHAISPEAQAFAVEAGVDIVAHGMFRWEEQPDNVTQLTPDVRKVLDGVIDARMGWQPTMQVLVGFRDLADPQYLSDPTLARVVPPELIEWYKSSDGQSFRERNGLPPADAVRWNAVQAVRDAPLERNENVARYLASRNARIVFGTDTPAAPFLYTNPAE